MSRKRVLYLPLGLPTQLYHPCTALYDMNAALKVATKFMYSSVNKLTASLILWHLNGMSCYGFQAKRIFGLLFCSQVYTLFMFPFWCSLYNNPPLIVCRPPSFSSHHWFSQNVFALRLKFTLLNIRYIAQAGFGWVYLTTHTRPKKNIWSWGCKMSRINILWTRPKFFSSAESLPQNTYVHITHHSAAASCDPPAVCTCHMLLSPTRSIFKNTTWSDCTCSRACHLDVFLNSWFVWRGTTKRRQTTISGIEALRIE